MEAGDLEGELGARVAAGADNTACLTAGGKLVVWGGGQLPQMVDLSGQTVVNMAVGSSTVLCTTSTGQIFETVNVNHEQGWGPLNHLPLEGHHAVQVSVGGCEACVTSTGGLFTWGSNFNGQLGHGDFNNISTPTRVRLPFERKVAQVATGGRHTVCVTVDGAVLSWGKALDGRLGLGDQLLGLDTLKVSKIGASTSWTHAGYTRPTLVGGTLAGRPVAHVAAAARQTVCTTLDGAVFGFGHCIGCLPTQIWDGHS